MSSSAPVWACGRGTPEVMLALLIPAPFSMLLTWWSSSSSRGRAAVERSRPTPAAYRPHRAWLKATSSATFGWLVKSATTSSCSEPRTSSTKPCRAFFGPTSTKTRAPGAVERLQALDELHGRGDLPAGELQHGLGGGTRRVEVTRHVGDDRLGRRLQLEPAQRVDERPGCRRDDRGVEGVADRDPGRGEALGGEPLDDPLDGVGGTADDRLAGAVDVGDDDVAVGRVDDALDVGHRGEHGCHRAVVRHRHLGHLAAAGADGLEGARRVSAPAATRAPYSPRLWPITMSGCTP